MVFNIKDVIQRVVIPRQRRNGTAQQCIAVLKMSEERRDVNKIADLGRLDHQIALLFGMPQLHQQFARQHNQE